MQVWSRRKDQKNFHTRLIRHDATSLIHMLVGDQSSLITVEDTNKYKYK
jgi:hypothetical protein